MKTAISKYHIAGADYIITDSSGKNPGLFPAISKSLCDRHSGVGADGVVFTSACSGADAGIMIYRPDGTPSKSGLSALLCASFFISSEMCAGKTDLTITSGAHSYRVILTRDIENPHNTTAAVDAGKVSFLPSEIPLSVNSPVIDRLTEVGNRIFRVTALSCSFSPWAVVYSINLENCNTAQYGAILANHSLFSEKCDVVFAQQADISDCITTETYVRGVGIPLSEGSAALAAVCAGVKLGRLSADRKIRVLCEKGELTALCTPDNTAMLSGEVSEVFRGEAVNL